MIRRRAVDCWLEIIREDGTLERQLLEGDQITVGRSPTAGIPIVDARGLEPEHLMVAPRADGCWVAVAQGAPAVQVGGETFQHGMLAWGSEIAIGGLRLKVTDKLPKETKDPSEKKVSAPIMIAFFIIIPLVGWLLLADDDAALDSTPAADPPELFDAQVPCETGGGGTARHGGDRAAEAAIAKQERYPFHAQDGVEAVILYQRAYSCYRSLNATEQAAAMERERQALQARIEEDFRTHRLRLRRAVEQGRHPDALLETRSLINLVEHREGHAYLLWLRDFERQLQLAIDEASAG